MALLFGPSSCEEAWPCQSEMVGPRPRLADFVTFHPGYQQCVYVVNYQ